MDGSDLVNKITTHSPDALQADAGASMTLRFWGVRGSISCGGRDTMRYGGNTSSVEIGVAGRTLIFDGGTGVRYLGKSLVAAGRADGDVFLSHVHFDHVCGLPFFPPFFEAGQKWRLWSGVLEGASTTHDLMEDLMRPPFFPVPPEIFNAQVECRDFRPGDVIDLGGGIVVRTAPLNHPNGATGYRVEHNGHSICYVTDTEHRPGGLDRTILDLVANADTMIYDATYCDADYAAHEGYGHSTWEEGVRIADAANVKTFIAFHHDPDHDDEFLDRVSSRLSQMRPGSLVAREGLTLQV